MDPFSQMRKVLESFHPFTEEAWEDFSTLFSFAELDKGEYFVREGTRNDRLAFIIDGALRAFYVDQDGTFYNKTFFINGSFAVSLASVLQNIMR